MELHRFVRDNDGVTAIEYALIASLIAVVIIIVLTNVGGGIQATFNILIAGGA